ncbi:hypothetical protein K4L44_15975 [Halosquirtibacter laminarini]|uniref:Uncharacterized protein n=1 Tax=Halosquirtibacter laminarini TaxID=3374600 RepID=A0AC61NEI9_9BACT|nr:hypothetical protein K4L44_15975 [Prolixibacteraceae bacterium]
MTESKKKIQNWTQLCFRLGEMFRLDLDENGVFMLIGIRERGWGFKEYTKEEKLNLIYLGTATLLCEMNRITKVTTDRDGWPVFKEPNIVAEWTEVQKIGELKKGAIVYFNRIWGLN